MEGVEIPESTTVMIVNSSNPDAFPIAGFTWILTYQDQSDRAAGSTLAHLLWWAIHDGQPSTSSLDYAGLSPAAVAAAENQIMKLTSGGQPLLP